MDIKNLVKKAEGINLSKLQEFKQESKKMKIGIMGGTFNPIHYAHLLTAEFIREKYELDKIVFIPSGNPPHKKNNILNKYDRYNMVSIAVMDNENFLISDIEVKKEQKTYTIDTLRYIKSNYSNLAIYFITGADAIYDIESWKDVKENFEIATFIAATRPGISNEKFQEKIKALKNKYNANIISIGVPALDISSTYIRNQLENNNSIKYLVSEGVYRYIHSNNLYRDGEQ